MGVAAGVGVLGRRARRVSHVTDRLFLDTCHASTFPSVTGVAEKSIRASGMGR